MTDNSPADRFHALLQRVTEGERLSSYDAAAAVVEMIEGRASEIEMAALLSAWKTRGETAEEIAGVVGVFRDRMVKVECRSRGVVDTCGTGGDGFGTFNVSTAAAFVAAGAGVPVAKHGNRAVSSRSGSADVLAALGVAIDVPASKSGEILDEVGIVFLFAPRFHPAFARVAPIRRALRLRTIFNVVGPLVNPAGVTRQIVGVYRKELLPLVAQTLASLGAEHALVVHGEEGDTGLDEITTTGPTLVYEVKAGEIGRSTFTPEQFGFRRVALDELAGGGAQENAELIRRILGGEEGAPRDLVLFNAGAAIYVSGRADSVAKGIERARDSIDSGRARGSLDRLIEVAGAFAGKG